MSKRRRRKPIKCLLCQTEETYDVDAICGDCRTQWQMGLAYQKRVARGSFKQYAVAWYWELYHWAGDPSHGRDACTKKIRDSLLELAQVKEVEYAGAQFFAKREAGPMLGLRQGKDHDTSYSIYHGRPGVFKLLVELVQWIQNYGAAVYEEGKGDGEGFVRKLASGNLSMNELNDYELNRSK